MGTKSRGLVLLTCAGEVGSPGSPAGWFGVRGALLACGRGASRPSPALRSVQAGSFPTAFIRALVETGGAAHGLSRDVIPTRRRARPVRSATSARGHAAAAAPFAL